jgi:hypothetical protein
MIDAATKAGRNRKSARPVFTLLSAAAIVTVAAVAGALSGGCGERHTAPGIKGAWGWNDSSIFEFQKIDCRFTADSFFLAQRFFDPAKPQAKIPCALSDHEIHAAGRYVLAGDTLRFKGDFTDSRFSRDTLRLCRDTGFKGSSHFSLRRDTLCLQAPGNGKGVCLVRVKSRP